MSEPTEKIVYQRLTFSGNIHFIQSDHELKAVSKQLLAAAELGFDTETKPAFKKGEVNKVALLQLSTETDSFVIRLHHVTDFQILKSVFENEKITKVGVAIRDDLKGLQKLFPFNPKNFIELQTLAKAKGLKNFGLKGMTEEILQMTLSKGPKLTNWEAKILTPQQIMYAATDAWIGLELYHKMKALKDAEKPQN